MQDLQQAKARVMDLYQALEDTADSAAALGRSLSADCLWRGMHPFDVVQGPERVAQVFWDPLRGALRHLQRRMDVFMAGRNEIDGFSSVWVVSMGHLMGLFDAPWLGIAPTGRLTLLRYAEFLRVEGGKITEIAMFCDIPAVMMQAGLRPFPDQTGAQLVHPGPRPHDSLMFDAQPAHDGDRTLEVINAMITDLGQWTLGLPLEEELARTWHDDMLWWGPAGIGATYTIERYARQHSGPFRAGFADRTGTGHLCRLAEGHYGGFFGWPNFTARPVGGFMGMPGSQTPGEFRVVDIYRRRGDKLVENWVFIDLLHFWKGQGLDILGRLATLPVARG